MTFEIYHEFSVKENIVKILTCTNVRSNTTMCVKFPTRNGPAWELNPKPSHSERKPVPSRGTSEEARMMITCITVEMESTKTSQHIFNT